MTSATASAQPLRFRRIAALPFQTLADETLVVNPRMREVHLLNETAARVWELLEAPRTTADLLGALRAEFDGPAEDIGRDLELLITDLTQKGLVEPDPATPSGGTPS